MKYDPWHDSHAPMRFHDEPEPAWVQWVGGAAAGVVLAVMLFLMV